MESITRITFFTILAVFFATCSCKHHADPNDPVWKERAEEALRMAYQAYNPDPYSVVDHLNTNVHMAIERSNNNSRRSLTNTTAGGCVATNPIDQCWRCQPNWAENRFRLADCGLGFGRHATGGKGGEIYVVTDSSDNDMMNPKIGTLRHAVIQDGPLWIIFKCNMVIRLSQELIMTSNKTIDGRGVQIHIKDGAGFMLQNIHNVIIHNIRIHDIMVGNGGIIRDSQTHYGLRTQSDGDGISIFGSSNIWIDHVSFSNCYDGTVDAIQASTAITISNCHFVDHNHVILLGASNTFTGDKIMQVTIAFNHFGRKLTQRMPRVRYGFAHVVNNDYWKWEMYAIGGTQNPTILSQGNRFYAPDNPHAKEITKRDALKAVWKNWVWKSEGDVMINGAFFVPSGNPSHNFQMHSDKTVSPKPGNMVAELTQCAGPLACVQNKPC